jgi:ATP-binding cassette subfamily C protein PrsD
VLDEPNANLDADGETSLGRAIHTLRTNGSVVIVISHRPSALAVVDMAMVLFEGETIAFGACEEIFARIEAGAGKPEAAIHPAAARTVRAMRRAAIAETA